MNVDQALLSPSISATLESELERTLLQQLRAWQSVEHAAKREQGRVRKLLAELKEGREAA